MIPPMSGIQARAAATFDGNPVVLDVAPVPTGSVARGGIGSTGGIGSKGSGMPIYTKFADPMTLEEA